MRKMIEMDFEFMNTIPEAPKKPQEMYAQACGADQVTVAAWKEIWTGNAKANLEKYGPFKNNSVGSFFASYKHQPAICAGAGPSLRNSIEELKKVKDIPIVSCLHNYHFMVDHEIPVTFYVTLDAGEVTIEEISEGGAKTHDEYIESTKDKILFAFIGSSPKLIESWKGKVYWFNCPIPDAIVQKQMDDIANFHTYVSTGGNVLGACVYIAKAIMGCNPIAFVGADFSFSYLKQFHAWNSKYDGKLGQAMRGTDVWGNCVLTWQSYFNFKIFFDWLCSNVAGLWINCTEGGMLGAYPEGNIQQIKQMRLKDFLWMYKMYEEIGEQCRDPGTKERKILY